MSSERQWQRLVVILERCNLAALFEGHRDVLLARIRAFEAAYCERVQSLSEGILPDVSLDSLLDEYDRNPHRVVVLLQGIAFLCSPDMLAMMWMVMLGSTIETLSYEYRRADASRTRVQLLLPDRTSRLSFSSDVHWDAAVLKLATLSLADEAPMVEGFLPLYVPPGNQ